MTNQDSNYVAALGIEPGEVATPTSPADVAALLGSIGDRAVIPWGGGTGQRCGRPPRRADVLLNTSGLNHVVAHEFADMTVTVEAGVTLAALQETLAQHNQFLPLDPPDAESATLGGIVASDATGPLRLGYGRVRDWLIGITVVDAAGRLIHGGGKVVKNVTGYDLPKLYAGSQGTLGVVVEATFKVSPRPEAVRTVAVRLDPSADLKVFLLALRAAAEPVQLVVHEDPDGRFLAALFHGAHEAVDAASARMAEAAHAAGLGQIGVYAEDLTPETPAAALEVRLSGKPVAALGLHALAAEEALATGAILSTRWGVGDTAVRWSDATDGARAAVHRLAALARLRDFSFEVTEAPVDLRGDESLELWVPTPSALPLMRRLKASLDPAETLNPGRFLGDL